MHFDGQTIPKGYLIYLARPNSDAYITAEDAEFDESTYDWGYVLPSALFADVGEGIFFQSDGTPIVVLASEILADSGTNNGPVLFKSTSATQQTGRLVIYPTGTDAATLAKAKKILRIT